MSDNIEVYESKVEPNELDFLEQPEPESSMEADAAIPDIEEPYVMSDEEIQFRAELATKLAKRKKMFAQYPEISAQIPPIEKLYTMSISELNAILLSVDFVIRTHSSELVVRTSIYSGCSLIEKLAPIIGMDLEGLTNIVTNESNENFDYCIKELSLKYDTYTDVSPEVKLCGLLASTMMGLNRVNKAKKMVLAEQNIEVKDDDL